MTTGFAAGLRASDVAPGTVVTVIVDGKSVCVGHTIDGRWGAIEDVCTHDGGDLADGRTAQDEAAGEFQYAAAGKMSVHNRTPS